VTGHEGAEANGTRVDVVDKQERILRVTVETLPTKPSLGGIFKNGAIAGGAALIVNAVL
jgi:hypothetical protein